MSKPNWLQLETTEGQRLRVIVDHIAMVSDFYVQETKMGADGHNHLEYKIIADKCNILLQGQYISIKGSPILVQTLIIQALTQEKVTGSNILEIPKKKS